MGLSSRSAVLKECSRDPWGSPRPFREVCEVKTIFIIVLRRSWPFALLFFREHAVDFSRGHVTWYAVLPPTADRMHAFMFSSLWHFPDLVFDLVTVNGYNSQGQELSGVLGD